MSVTKNTQNIRKGVSEKESHLLCTLANKGKTIIDLKDISDITHASHGYAKVIANRLCSKRWLLPIVRGRYLIVPLEAGVESRYTEHSFIIASQITKNSSYYIAYWTALNYYNYTEQTPFTVFVVTTSRVPSIVIHGVKYKFVTITKRKLFGIKTLMIGRQKVFISDKEKTIVDALDHPEYCGGIVTVAECLLAAIKNDNVSFERLIEYAALQNSTIIKRLGYLIDVLEIKIPSNIYKQMLNLIKSGYSLLEPLSAVPTKNTTNSKWKLFLNVSNEFILEAKSTMDT